MSTANKTQFDGFAAFFRYLSHFHPLSSCVGELRKRLIRVSLPPKAVILRPGQVSKHLCFIESGCLMASETRGGKDFINWVLTDGAMAHSARSFYTQSECTEMVECVEPSVIVMLGNDDLEFLIQHFHDFAICYSKMMAHITVIRELKFALSSIPDAESRVRRMALLEPQLFSRVPLNVMASYLSMTPETLSRITHKKDMLPLFKSLIS